MTKRRLFGAAFFCIWLALAELWAVMALTGMSLWPRWVQRAVPAAVICAYAVSFALSAWFFLRIRSRRDCEPLYREAMAAFVAGDFDGAEENLNEILRTNALDGDCIFLKAHIALARGRKRRARRLFRKCRDFDEEGKWAWEIKSTLETL